MELDVAIALSRYDLKSVNIGQQNSCYSHNHCNAVDMTVFLLARDATLPKSYQPHVCQAPLTSQKDHRMILFH